MGRLSGFAAVAAIMVAPMAARAQAVPVCPVALNGGCGAVIPVGAPSIVFNGVPGANPVYERLINVGTPTSGVAWCSRSGTPVVNGGGSFPLAPFGNSLSMPSVEEYVGRPVPLPTTISCVSDGAGGSAAAVLTVETR